MSFDIYGNTLAPGCCEVHPYVQAEYPCPLCFRDAAEDARIKAIEQAAAREMEQAYHREMAERRAASEEDEG